MKKTQLRKLIRESIKQLMTEQSYTVNGIQCNIRTCTGGTSHGNFCVPNSAYPNGVQIGDHFKIDQYHYTSLIGRHVFVRNVGASGCMAGGYMGTVLTTITPLTSCCQNCTNPNGWQQLSQNFGGACTTSCTTPPPPPCTSFGCTDPTAMNYNSTILPNCDQGCVYAYQLGCTDSTASNYDPAAIYDDGSCILGNAGCPTCDSSAWPNHSNWINTWTNLPNFSSSNPNQPCNMICNKLQIWDNNCQNAGPVQANQFACKIEEAQNQSQIHGCNC